MLYRMSAAIPVPPVGTPAITIDAPWPRRSTAWAVVALFCVAAILSYTDRQILSLLVDPIRADLHISDTQVGILQGVAFAVIYALAGLPLGRLADIAQRRRVLLAGVALWSVGTLACGYAPDFATLFAGRLIVGIGEAALAPAAMSIIGDLFPPHRRGLAIGVFIMGMAVGGGVAISIGGAVLGLVADGALDATPLAALAAWRAVLTLLGLCGVPLLALLAFIPEPPRRGALAQRPSLTTTRRELSGLTGAIVPLVLACAAMSIGDFAMLSWGPTLLIRRYGLSAPEVGATLGPLIITAGVLAALGGGALSDRFARARGTAGRLRLAALSAAIALPFAFIALTASASQALAAITLWTLFSTVAGLAGITALQAIVPNRARGLAMSLIAFGNIILGLGGGATLTGYLADHVFHDPGAVGRALSLVIVPPALAAIALYLRAARRTP